MAETDDATMARIRQYAEEARNMQVDAMDVDRGHLEARLRDTVSQLQERVKQQQAELNRLKSQATAPLATRPSPNRQTKLAQLQSLKTAYESLANEDPELPPPDSLIPTLLAARLTRDAVSTTSSDITRTQSQLATTSTHLQTEQAALSDSLALRTALTNRLTHLRATHTAQTQKSSNQLARELLANQQSKTKTYARETRKLQQLLHDFIDAHLATPLAAEELGGPIVGDAMELDEEDLMAGFSSSGKPRKTKRGADARGQKRLDEIWGETQRDGATSEMRELLEQLLKAGWGESPDGLYVSLGRDSAAARFLVRSKVAVYHPKDARRLRLIDFGRELDD